MTWVRRKHLLWRSRKERALQIKRASSDRELKWGNVCLFPGYSMAEQLGGLWNCGRNVGQSSGGWDAAVRGPDFTREIHWVDMVSTHKCLWEVCSDCSLKNGLKKARVGSRRPVIRVSRIKDRTWAILTAAKSGRSKRLGIFPCRTVWLASGLNGSSEGRRT